MNHLFVFSFRWLVCNPCVPFECNFSNLFWLPILEIFGSQPSKELP